MVLPRVRRRTTARVHNDRLVRGFVVLGLIIAVGLCCVLVRLRFEPEEATTESSPLLLLRKQSSDNSQSTKERERSDELWGHEKEAALSYVKSIKSFSRTLKFFHIPKTAGTAIESAAGKHKIAWGSCLFSHKPRRSECSYPKGGEWPRNTGWWHVPSQLFPMQDINPYQGAELFGAIRDPYERMVSEFYYICTLKVLSWRPDQCDRTRLFDKEYMNEWLRAKMKDQLKDPSGLSYLRDNGHFTSQYDFIFGPHQVRMIDHVLPIDDADLSEKFSRLMEAFSLDKVKLQKLNALGAAARESGAHLEVEHLDQQTLACIDELYEKDFMLGYSYRGSER
jgi:hypothetical protein